MRGWSSSSSTASIRWLRNGIVEERPPVGLERDPDERLRRSSRRGASACAASEVSRIGGVVDGVGGQHVHALPVERRRVAVVGGARAARRGARVVAQRGEARRRAAAAAARPTPARGRRTCGAAGRTAGRCRAPWSAAAARRRSAPSSSTSSRILRNSSGPGVALREPERDGPTGAPVDLGHPVHLGARAFVVGARALEARRDFVHAVAAAAEHVGDREQLAFVGPRSRHGPAVGDAVQQRARRREAERARAPSPRRRGRTSPRCRRRSPASRRGCARPSRSGAPRSARPCRRR